MKLLCTDGSMSSGPESWTPPRSSACSRDPSTISRKVAGRQPQGIRARGSGFSPHTFDLIRNAGFLSDSSLLAADEPYEIVSNGKPSGVIELPISEIDNDYPYYGETANGALPSPDGVFQVFKSEFDVVYEERTLNRGPYGKRRPDLYPCPAMM